MQEEANIVRATQSPGGELQFETSVRGFHSAVSDEDIRTSIDVLLNAAAYDCHSQEVYLDELAEKDAVRKSVLEEKVLEDAIAILIERSKMDVRWDRSSPIGVGETK